MSNQPVVSVLMTCYNHQDYVAEALESCLGQDYESLEIVVADDCSTDNSATIIQQYADKYPNIIKFLRNPKNLGLTKNLNHALANCTGKYIVFVSADDAFLPGKISKQVPLMEADPNLAISYHDVQVFRESDSQILYNIADRYKPRNGGPEIMLQGGIFFSCIGCMVRSSAKPKWGYDEEVKLCSDWFFMAETLITSGGQMRYMPGIYALHRRHDSNITDAYKNRLIDEEREAINRLAFKYPSLQTQLEGKNEHLNAMKVVKLMSGLRLKDAYYALAESRQPLATLLLSAKVAIKELAWRLQARKYMLYKSKRLRWSN